MKWSGPERIIRKTTPEETDSLLGSLMVPKYHRFLIGGNPDPDYFPGTFPEDFVHLTRGIVDSLKSLFRHKRTNVTS